jgi:hypothetical protein
MPWGDRTGPMGIGPMTGRAAGYCAGFANPRVPGRGGRGRGRGWGRGMGQGWGSGFRGRGWGLRSRGRGFRWDFAPYGYTPYY